jgi:hypothetical protein
MVSRSLVILLEYVMKCMFNVKVKTKEVYQKEGGEIAFNR